MIFFKTTHVLSRTGARITGTLKKKFSSELGKFPADGFYIKSNIFLISGRIAFDHYNFLQNYACTIQNWRQNYWNSKKKIFVGTWKISSGRSLYKVEYLFNSRSDRF